ncbi:hypothetical protein CLF_108882, partial [Clonorchis sinensis]
SKTTPREKEITNQIDMQMGTFVEKEFFLLSKPSLQKPIGDAGVLRSGRSGTTWIAANPAPIHARFVNEEKKRSVMMSCDEPCFGDVNTEAKSLKNSEVKGVCQTICPSVGGTDVQPTHWNLARNFSSRLEDIMLVQAGKRGFKIRFQHEEQSPLTNLSLPEVGEHKDWIMFTHFWDIACCASNVRNTNRLTELKASLKLRDTKIEDLLNEVGEFQSQKPLGNLNGEDRTPTKCTADLFLAVRKTGGRVRLRKADVMRCGKLTNVLLFVHWWLPLLLGSKGDLTGARRNRGLQTKKTKRTNHERVHVNIKYYLRIRRGADADFSKQLNKAIDQLVRKEYGHTSAALNLDDYEKLLRPHVNFGHLPIIHTAKLRNVFLRVARSFTYECHYRVRVSKAVSSWNHVVPVNLKLHRLHEELTVFQRSRVLKTVRRPILYSNTKLRESLQFRESKKVAVLAIDRKALHCLAFEGFASAVVLLPAGMDFLASIMDSDLDDIQLSGGRIGEVGQSAESR